MRKSRSTKSDRGQPNGMARDLPPFWVMGVAVAITVGFIALLMAA